MEEDLFTYKSNRSRAPRQGDGRDNLFAWTIALLLLVGLAVGVWIASYYVFSHPEEPLNYKWLERLGQIQELQRFEVTKAPRGEFLTVKEMYERFGSLPGYELANRNERMVRDYIRNYSSLEGRLPYLIGKFNVLDSFALSEADVITSGAVVLAQSEDFPGILVEHLYPASAETGAALIRSMRTGTAITLKKTLDLAAVLQVTKLRDGRLLLTVMPLLYGSYALDDASPAISLDPPRRLNLAAGWPVVKPVEVEAAEMRYRQFLRENGLSEPSPDTPTLAPALPKLGEVTELGGIDPHATPVPSKSAPIVSPQPNATATPGRATVRQTMPVAPAIPVVPESTPITKAPTPSPTLARKPTPAMSWPPGASSTPEAASAPAATSAPAAAVRPPASASVGPSGIPLKPFLATDGAKPAPQSPQPPAETPPSRASSSKWRTYPPGQMPRGRLVEVSEAAKMSGGTRGERTYLSGDFVVTAVEPGKAIMRSKTPLNLPVQIPGITPQARVIVEFPQAGMEPGEGSKIRRDAQRPFQILSVETGSDGVVNIYAREVTSP